MEKLAFSIIKYRKKNFFILVSIIATAIIALVTTDGLFDAVIRQRYEENQTKFGTYHAMLCNVTEENRQLLSAPQNNVVQMGELYNYGSFLINDVNMTVGSFDETAHNQSNLILLEGRWPKDPDEMVLEKAYFKTLDSVNIGDKLTVTQGAVYSKQYKLVGIIQDYSSYRNVPEYVQNGYGDLPSAIIAKDMSLAFWKYLLINWHTYNDAEILNTCQDSEVDIYSIVLNDKMYASSENERRGLSANKYIFEGILLIFFLISFTICLKLNLNNSKKFYRGLFLLGAGKWQSSRVFCTYLLSMALTGTALGCILGILLSRLIALSIELPIGQPAISAFSIIVFMGAILMAGGLNFYYFIKHNTRGTISSTDHITKIKVMDDFRYAFLNNNFKCDIFKILPLMLAIIIMLAAVAHIQFALNSLYVSKKGDIPDYTITAQEMTSYDLFGPFAIKASSIELEFEPLEKLLFSDCVENAYMRLNNSGAALVFEDKEENRAWKQWQNTDAFSHSQIRETDCFFVDDYNILVLEDHLFSKITNEFSIDGQGIILFSPTDPSAELDSLTVGHMELNRPKDYREALAASDLTYKEYELPIDICVYEKLSYSDSNISLEYTAPTILIPLRQFNNTFRYLGAVDSVRIYLKNDAVNAELQQYSEKIKQYIHRFPSSFFYDLSAEIEMNRISVRLVNIVNILIFIIIFCYIVVSYYGIARNLIEAKCKIWGIYRALGFSRKLLVKMVFLELFCYSLLSIVISLIFNYAYCLNTGDFTLFTGSLFPTAILCIVLIITSFAASGFLLRQQKNGNIAPWMQRE